MKVKNKNYYIRCQGCIYCREIELKKGNKVIASQLECTCEFVEEILNDFVYCGCYKKYIGGCEEQMEEFHKKKEKSQAELLAEAMHQQTMDVVDGYVGHVDMVNHPKHYADSCSIECIDAMQVTFGTKDLAKYCVINAYKYLWRYKNKNGREDLNKAEWYLNKFDELLEESDNKPYSEQIPSRYVNICITLRKWLKMANTALGVDTVNEE